MGKLHYCESFFFSTASKVMITTGYPWSFARKTEIVDVVSGLSCSDLDDFPVEIKGSVGANLHGIPVVCGGDLGSSYSEKCYGLTNGAWEEFASMKQKRAFAAGVTFNKKLHVFGGYNSDSSMLKTSEIINVNGEVSDGPDLPTAVWLHAMTSINDTVSLLSGIWDIGSTTAVSARTWFYNHDTESFTSGPDLLEARYSHGSATNVDKVTKAQIAVITGGYGVNGRMDSTELLINGQWEKGTIQCRIGLCCILYLYSG